VDSNLAVAKTTGKKDATDEGSLSQTELAQAALVEQPERSGATPWVPPPASQGPEIDGITGI
jgi:hypothetical protein